MFCSVIIPTVNRATLARAATAVLAQAHAGFAFELVVVNDSGRPLTPADWQHDERVRFIHTNRRRVIAARNAGAAIAKGDYLLFLDDDDWLLPDALQNFYRLAQTHPDSPCLYGGANLINDKNELLGQINLNRTGNCAVHLLAGSWIPFGAYMVKADAFFASGLFPATFRSGEETHIQRLLALRGDFAHLEAPVVNIFRGSGWQTTADYDAGPLYNRISRDLTLGEPGAFARLRASAEGGYWYGRFFHAYVTAVRWNIEQKCIFTAFSRAFYAMLAFLSAGRHIFSRQFWRAVKDSKVPCTEARVYAVKRSQPE